MVRTAARAIALLLLPAATACGAFDGACGESRVINLYAAPNGSDIRTVDQQTRLSTVGMSVNRGRAVMGGFERSFQWQVLSGGPVDSVTFVRLYQGDAATGSGTLLYEFPPAGAAPDQNVVSSGAETDHEQAVGSWYAGTVPFEDLMLALYQSPTYLEIRTTSQPDGVRTALGTPAFFAPPDNPTVWHKYYCD